MSTNLDRQELAQIIREVIREDPSIITEALQDLRNKQNIADKSGDGLTDRERTIIDDIFMEYKEVFDALA